MPSDVVDVQEDATRSPEQVAELLDRGPDRRRVDDREHLVHVLADESVEEHLVAVVQLGEEDPVVDVGLAGLELLEAAGHLLFDASRRPTAASRAVPGGRGRPA